VPAVHTERWLGVAKHADGCQLGLRATGYWLVPITNRETALQLSGICPQSN